MSFERAFKNANPCGIGCNKSNINQICRGYGVVWRRFVLTVFVFYYFGSVYSIAGIFWGVGCCTLHPSCFLRYSSPLFSPHGQCVLYPLNPSRAFDPILGSLPPWLLPGVRPTHYHLTLFDLIGKDRTRSHQTTERSTSSVCWVAW